MKKMGTPNAEILLKITERNERDEYACVPIVQSIFRCDARGGVEIDDAEIEYERVPKIFLEGVRRPMIIRVAGDSMAPNLTDGDRLIVDQTSEVANDAVAAVYYNGSFLVKRLRIGYMEITLVSDNSKYKPIKPCGDDIFYIIGKAIRVVKELG